MLFLQTQILQDSVAIRSIFEIEMVDSAYSVGEICQILHIPWTTENYNTSFRNFCAIFLGQILQFRNEILQNGIFPALLVDTDII